jgi:hypothetical protein
MARGVGKLQGTSECSRAREEVASGRRGRFWTSRQRYGVRRARADKSWRDVAFQRDTLRCSLVLTKVYSKNLN